MTSSCVAFYFPTTLSVQSVRPPKIASCSHTLDVAYALNEFCLRCQVKIDQNEDWCLRTEDEGKCYRKMSDGDNISLLCNGNGRNNSQLYFLWKNICFVVPSVFIFRFRSHRKQYFWLSVQHKHFDIDRMCEKCFLSLPMFCYWRQKNDYIVINEYDFFSSQK